MAPSADILAIFVNDGKVTLQQLSGMINESMAMQSDIYLKG